MAYLKKGKSTTGTCSPEGSTGSSSPASSVNLTAPPQQQAPQFQQPGQQLVPQPPSHILNNAGSPNNNNAPKFGTVVPNRIFVGGISSTTTESELAQLFSSFGNVKATKVISDRAGISKGYGFVTFETEEEANRLVKDSDCITLKERKLNIGPAIMKQPFTRPYEATSPPSVPSNTIFFQNGVPYHYHNGMAFFPSAAPAPTPAAPLAAPADPVYQAATYGPPQPAPTHAAQPTAATYPVMYCQPQPVYLPPQYQYSQVPYDYFQSATHSAQYVFSPPGMTSNSSTMTAPNNPGNSNNGGQPPQTSPMTGAPAPSSPPPMPAHQYYASATVAHSSGIPVAEMYYAPYQMMTSTGDGVVYEAQSSQIESATNQSEDNSDSSEDRQSSKLEEDESMKSKMNQGRQNVQTPVVSLLKIQRSEEIQIQSRSIQPDIPGAGPQFESNGSNFVFSPPPQNSSGYPYPPPCSSAPQTLVVPGSGQSGIMYNPVCSQNPSIGIPMYFEQPNPVVMPPYMHSQGSRFGNKRPLNPRSRGNGRRGGIGGTANRMNIHIPPFPENLQQLANSSLTNNGERLGMQQNRNVGNRNPFPQKQDSRGDGRRKIWNAGMKQGNRFGQSDPNDFKTPQIRCKTNSASNTPPPQLQLPPPAPPIPVVPFPCDPNTNPESSLSSAPQMQFYTSRQAMPPSYYQQPANGQLVPQHHQWPTFMTSSSSSSGSRRFPNGPRKANGTNGNMPTRNGSSKFGKNSMQILNSAMNNNNNSTNAGKGMVDEAALGGAGDAPPMNQGSSTIIKPVVSIQDTCHQMQSLNI